MPERDDGVQSSFRRVHLARGFTLTFIPANDEI
jgi:hypothetical protein